MFTKNKESNNKQHIQFVQSSDSEICPEWALFTNTPIGSQKKIAAVWSADRQDQHLDEQQQANAKLAVSKQETVRLFKIRCSLKVTAETLKTGRKCWQMKPNTWEGGDCSHRWISFTCVMRLGVAGGEASGLQSLQPVRQHRHPEAVLRCGAGAGPQQVGPSTSCFLSASSCFLLSLMLTAPICLLSGWSSPWYLSAWSTSPRYTFWPRASS